MFNSFFGKIVHNLDSMVNIQTSSGSTQGIDQAVFVISLVVGFVSIAVVIGIILYTNLIGKEDAESKIGDPEGQSKLEKTVVNQIACPICGNADLAFVNVIYSKKRLGFFIPLVIVVSIVLLISFCIVIGVNVAGINQSEFVGDQIVNGISLYIVLGIVFDIISLLLLISTFIKLIPYYNSNEIRYVCKRCGHHNNINTIRNKRKVSSSVFEIDET